MNAPAEEPRRRRSPFPKAIGASLTALLKPIYKQHGFGEHRILTEWASIVGDDMAACSVPQKISRARGSDAGTLHIQISPAHALEMQYRLPSLIERINGYFGHDAIRHIKFVPSSHIAPPVVKNAPPPLPDAVYAPLANQCEDPGLRDALASLGAAIGAANKE